jgi:hypothetical protein
MQSIKSRSQIPSLIFLALAREPLRAVKSPRLSIEHHNEYDLDRHTLNRPQGPRSRRWDIETDSQFESTSKAHYLRLIIASLDAMLG